jgi:mono/diheme cytochrome c family protein
MLRGVIVGIVVGVLLVIFGIYFYFAGGHAPVTTKSPEMPFEHKLAHMAQHAYLDKQPHLNPPVPPDDTNLIAGADVYKDHCAVCHGLPGLPKNPIAEGMFPEPPQLFRGTGVTDDEPWETYWKVYGGIRMTGMPGFGDHLGETKTWQVSLLLKNADKISPAVKAALLSPAEANHDHGPSSAPVPTSQTPPATAPAAPASTAPATH